MLAAINWTFEMFSLEQFLFGWMKHHGTGPWCFQ